MKANPLHWPVHPPVRHAFADPGPGGAALLAAAGRPPPQRGHVHPAGHLAGAPDPDQLENFRFEMYFKFFQFVELSDSSAAQLLVSTYCDKPAAAIRWPYIIRRP